MGLHNEPKARGFEHHLAATMRCETSIESLPRRRELDGFTDTPATEVPDMNSLSFRVSTVNPQYGYPGKYTADTISVEALAALIRNDPGINSQTLRVREARNVSDQAYLKAKCQCRAVVPAVCAPKGTQRKAMPLEYPSGLYPIDADQNVGDPKLAAAIIEDLKAVPHCVLAALSVGGRAAWAMLAGPKAYEWGEYDRLHRAMLATLPEGILRHTTVRGQHEPTRLRFVGADENVYLNREPTIADLSIQDPDSEPVHQGDDSNAWRGALEHLIAQQAFGDDNTRLAVGICMKSNGEPYSEWADACQRGGSTKPENFPKERWESFEAKDADWSAVIGLAVKAGFTGASPRVFNPFRSTWNGHQKARPGRWKQDALVRAPDDPWGDYTLPTQGLAPMTPYPMGSWQGRSAQFLSDLIDATGVKPEGCAAAAIGCLAATFQHSYVVIGLPAKPIPLSAFVLWIAGTSARKSTAWDAALEGHRNADDKVYRRWKSSEEEYKRYYSKRQGGGRARNPADGLKEAPPPAPTPKKPLLLGRDATVEALGVRMQGGRRDLVIENDEAALFARNWSGSGSQRARSFAAFSTLWSGGILDDDRTSGGGREVYVKGGSLSLCLSIQDDYGLEWALSAEAANGFSARTLIAYSEDPEPDDDTPRRDAALAALREMHARIEAYRSRLDSGVEYKAALSASKDRKPIKLTPGARATLRMVYQETKSLARSMPKGHASGFYRRIPEHVTRLGALWTLWGAFCEAQPGDAPPDDLLVDDETLQGAAEVVAWHGLEIQRLEARAGMTELTAACEEALRIAKAKAEDNGRVALERELLRQGKCKNDVELRARVVDELLRTSCVRVQKAQRGNPHIFLHPELR